MSGTESTEEALMSDQLVNPARCCPKCGSREYVFRGRKKLAAEAEQPTAVETKYACKICGHGWKEKVPLTGTR
jgi:DNA-directed RNA polymerase subunit M/transcription elongation factor TFIIS